MHKVYDYMQGSNNGHGNDQLLQWPLKRNSKPIKFYDAAERNCKKTLVYTAITFGAINFVTDTSSRTNVATVGSVFTINSRRKAFARNVGFPLSFQVVREPLLFAY